MQLRVLLRSGMAAPALVYIALNIGDSAAMRGWTIPTATDAVLALFGTRLPASVNKPTTCTLLSGQYVDVGRCSSNRNGTARAPV